LTVAEEITHEVIGFRGMAEESFEALGDCFRGDRLLAAGLGIGVAFVLAGVAGTAAAIYLLRNALAVAAMLGILAGFLVYAGLLLTYGALARMATAERQGAEISLGEAYAFVARRSHILIGIPLFILVVTLGVASLGAYIGASASASQGLGTGLAPLALVLLFLLNLILVMAVLVSHCLTAPCVARLDPSFATVGSRLIQVGRERLGAFFAYQAAGAVVGLPMLALVAGLFLAAFQPSFQATALGRGRALLVRQAEEYPAATPVPPGGVQPSTAGEEKRDWVERARGWAEWAANVAGAPLMSAAAVLLLLLGMFPLTYGASVQSAIYVGLTGDPFLAAPEGAQATAAEAPTPRRPPIVHCWRCDAINRYEADQCAKCGAALAICRHCFATNEPGRETCSSCGQSLAPPSAASPPEDTQP
jgi:ribosomal protein L40E